MFGQLAGKQQTHGGLDLPGSDGGALVVVSETRRLTGDALENIVHEGVHDAHGLRRDAGIGVHLLQDFVHVDGVALLPGLSAFLASFAGSLGHGFLRALLGRGLSWVGHDAAAAPRVNCERMSSTHPAVALFTGSHCNYAQEKNLLLLVKIHNLHIRGSSHPRTPPSLC